MRDLPTQADAEDSIDLIVEQALLRYEKYHGRRATHAEMERVARMAVVALDDHLTLSDGCYHELIDEVTALPPKRRPKWHSRLTDSSGMIRRVIFNGHTLLMRDAKQNLVPIIPVTVSSYVEARGDEQATKVLVDERTRRSADERAEVVSELGAMTLPALDAPRRRVGPSGRARRLCASRE